jgi:hypothetical protein
MDEDQEDCHKVTTICYLCGQALKPPISRDHVPPRQLYARTVRRKHNLSRLLSIRVHDACNKAYQHDEDYLINTLVPFARGSYAGNMLLKETIEKYHRGEQVGLIHKILSEFDPKPGGVLLPYGKIAKHFEGHRLKRVAFKIIRSLYFHNYGTVLPADVLSSVQIVSPDEEPPDHFFAALQDKDGMGQYPGVFDYKFAKFANNLHYWAMLFWDRIIAFHDPLCQFWGLPIPKRGG